MSNKPAILKAMAKTFAAYEPRPDEIRAGDDVRSLIVENPAVTYLANSLNSAESRSTMRRVLDYVSKLCGHDNMFYMPWAEIFRDQNQWLIARIKHYYRSEGLSYQTYNLYLSAIKGVALRAYKMKLIDYETYGVIKSERGETGVRVMTGTLIGASDIKKVLDDMLGAEFSDRKEQEKLEPGIRRDVALFAFMFGCGPRRNEAANVIVEDLNLISSDVTLKGKGNKERRIGIPESILPYLHQWLEYYQPEKSAPLFPPIDQWGNIKETMLTGNAIYKIVKRRLQEIDVSPHDFRRSVITLLLNEKAGIDVVAEFAGHANIATTQRYNLDKERQVKEAVEKIKF